LRDTLFVVFVFGPRWNDNQNEIQPEPISNWKWMAMGVMLVFSVRVEPVETILIFAISRKSKEPFDKLRANGKGQNTIPTAKSFWDRFYSYLLCAFAPLRDTSFFSA
jgi:hypothetical protein